MQTLIYVSYLISAVFFMTGLKKLLHPATARRGNFLAMMGMLIAIVATLLDQQLIDVPHIIIGMILGATLGEFLARKSKNTAMLQLVALFNGFGGAASVIAALSHYVTGAVQAGFAYWIPLQLSLLLGTVTFSGSVMIFARLRETRCRKLLIFQGRHVLNVIMILVAVGGGVGMILLPDAFPWVNLLVIVGAILGVLFTIPISGPDMPVVLALLNSSSGFVAALLGFVFYNTILIVCGALVGAAGIVLTQILCQGTNRSLWNVLFRTVKVAPADDGFTENRSVTRYTPEDAALILESAQSVIIVPGYGLAAARAQQKLRDITESLLSLGISVRYAVHPMAGRMPGHMNMVLAEANVSENLLLAMDKINDEFHNTDVVLVIGANDIINPAVRDKKNSPLHGMPILNVGNARSVIFCTRSVAPGFSGEPNALFYEEGTMMLIGDIKNTLNGLVQLLKQ